MKQTYKALKNIRYKAPGPRYRELILKGTPEAEGLTFDHLTSAEIKLLVRKGVIQAEPAPEPKEKKVEKPNG